MQSARATRGPWQQSMAKRLREVGFGAPRADQASVLVFDARSLAGDLRAASALLDRRERLRAGRFRFSRDRDTYTLAHGVWRVALGECLGLAADEVPLATTADGQPRLAGTAFSTSLSHSGTLVALTVCPAATVGVDIESYPARIDLDALMPTFCTRGEIAELRELREDERRRALLELWTRKEALLKAFGVGLLTDPATTPAPSSHLLLPPDNATHYPPCRTRNLPSNTTWIGAVAAPSAVRDVRLHVL